MRARNININIFTFFASIFFKEKYYLKLTYTNLVKKRVMNRPKMGKRVSLQGPTINYKKV